MKFQRWMKCLATSRAALPWTAEAMSCQGILGVVYLSMKSVQTEQRKVRLGQRARASGHVRRTVEGLLQLDPVLVDKVAVVLPVPEARVALQLPHVRLEAPHRPAA